MATPPRKLKTTAKAARMAKPGSLRFRAWQIQQAGKERRQANAEEPPPETP